MAGQRLMMWKMRAPASLPWGRARVGGRVEGGEGK